MSDFCYQCTSDVLGVKGEKNDFVGISSADDTAKGQYPVVLCEGCGPIQVDHTGRCVSNDCLYNHGK